MQLSCIAALASCGAAAEPFDVSRCKLQVETELTSSFAEDAWRLEKNYYPGLAYETDTGNVELLDKYLKQNGYFPVAGNPNDPNSTIRTYSTDAADERRREMAKPEIVSQVACDASYLSRAKLKSVWVISGMEPAFRVEFS